eukprot:TRINITY_DN29243_c0_g1_i1.p1 TRINITY_DN29243_c0_g1~~TRINITY_DN29243_c0_g1_i1.p1  ORF type:complete len:702 (+),score=137.15 TRINITY_DN29243_c0_g1_i1:98-2203(+)
MDPPSCFETIIAPPWSQDALVNDVCEALRPRVQSAVEAALMRALEPRATGLAEGLVAQSFMKRRQQEKCEAPRQDAIGAVMAAAESAGAAAASAALAPLCGQVTGQKVSPLSPCVTPRRAVPAPPRSHIFSVSLTSPSTTATRLRSCSPAASLDLSQPVDSSLRSAEKEKELQQDQDNRRREEEQVTEKSKKTDGKEKHEMEGEDTDALEQHQEQQQQQQPEQKRLPRLQLRPRQWEEEEAEKGRAEEVREEREEEEKTRKAKEGNQEQPPTECLHVNLFGDSESDALSQSTDQEEPHCPIAAFDQRQDMSDSHDPKPSKAASPLPRSSSLPSSASSDEAPPVSDSSDESPATHDHGPLTIHVAEAAEVTLPPPPELAMSPAEWSGRPSSLPLPVLPGPSSPSSSASTAVPSSAPRKQPSREVLGAASGGKGGKGRGGGTGASSGAAGNLGKRLSLGGLGPPGHADPKGRASSAAAAKPQRRRTVGPGHEGSPVPLRRSSTDNTASTAAAPLRRRASDVTAMKKQPKATPSSPTGALESTPESFGSNIEANAGVAATAAVSVSAARPGRASVAHVPGVAAAHGVRSNRRGSEHAKANSDLKVVVPHPKTVALAMQDQDPAVRCAALAAVLQLKGAAGRQVEDLVAAAASDGDAAVRAAARHVLSHQHESHPQPHDRQRKGGAGRLSPSEGASSRPSDHPKR